MAITITKIAGEPNSTLEMQFLIDNEDDVANLPTQTKEGKDIDSTAAPMSTALTSDGRLFVLCNDDKWHEW